MPDIDQPTLEAAASKRRGEVEQADRATERHLKAVSSSEAVDTDTGEVIERSCPDCSRMEIERDEATAEAEGMVETVKSQAAKIRMLRRDKEAAARKSNLWPDAVEAFRYWRDQTGHSRTAFTVDRFELLSPYLKKDGLAMVKLAIDGAVLEPHKASRPNINGKIEVYDSLETIFKTRASFERHVNRAPLERIRAVKEEGGLPPDVDDFELRIKAEVLYELLPATDKRSVPEKIAECVHIAREELTKGRKPPPGKVESQA